MVFSSLIFLWMFLPIVLGMYFLTKESYRNVLLLAASLFFYAWGEPVYVLVMILSIVINYIYGLKIGTEDETKRKRALVGGIVINLALLGVFKYSGFFMENVNAVFGLEVEVKKLPLPIGISFYTFQSISYLVDIYRRVCPPQKSLIKMGLFISFFPQLIAGPILKYYDIAAQIDNRKVSLPLFNQGAVRFLQGLAKKSLLPISWPKPQMKFLHWASTIFPRRWPGSALWLILSRSISIFRLFGYGDRFGQNVRFSH